MNTQPATPSLARPTPAQVAWHDLELELFACLDPCVWQDRQHDNHSAPLNQINPAQLDAEQWVDVAESLGAKLIVFVAKHDGGFCWWQTQTSDYGVKETPWRHGKGDVAADLAAACRRRGIRLGMYLSPSDLWFKAGLGGRCPTPQAQQRYDAAFRQQLIELLTRYGDIAEVWFDGSLVVPVADILARHAPEAMVFQGPQATIRWVGNEAGYAPYPAWNSLHLEDARTGVATAVHGNPDGESWMPMEVDTVIRHGCWFWNRETEDKLRTLDDLLEVYYRSVGHGAVLLLNSNPDTTGLIPAADARRTAELGAEIARRFGRSVGEVHNQTGEIELHLNAPARIDHVITMEDIAQGERIREYRIEGFADGKWQELVRGSAIGHKKIDFFAPQTVTALRFHPVRAVGQAALRKFAAYHAGAVPQFDRNRIWVHNPLLVGTWSDQVGESWTTLDVDITRPCSEARQYEIELKPSGSPSAVEINSVRLLQNGVEAADFVTPTANPLRWNLNVTACGIQMQLRFRLRRTTRAPTQGEIIIRTR